jgi:hypothetical protein
MGKIPGTQTCWAPELFYDEATKNYIIMWSSAVPVAGSEKPWHRAYYSLTLDFQTFTEPRILFDPGFNNIDTTMLRVGSKFVIVLKETDDQPAGKWGSIYAAIADKPLGPYTLLPNPPLVNQRAEGPALVTLGEKTLLYVDFYKDHRYGVYETADWKTWTDVTPTTAVISGQRHGSIFPVPATLLAELRKDEEKLIASVPKPILDGYRADPDIRVFGDTYYIYPTSDKPDWQTTDFSAWSSKDLIHWKNEGIILDVAHDLAWANIKAWAPTITERNGRYYFYFVAGDQIGVATGDKPTGPFKDALGKPLITRKQFSTYPIDPFVFTDTDGQSYLYFGNNHLLAAKLGADLLSLDGAPTDVTPQDPAQPFREGAVVFKRNGLYYFMWSVDDARSDDYRVAYGIAKSPFGPIEIRPNKVVLAKHGPAKGTAHNGVVNVPGTDRWYVSYHRHAVPGGSGYKRETCLVRMEFNPDGTIKPMDPLTTPFKPGDLGEPLAGNPPVSLYP